MVKRVVIAGGGAGGVTAALTLAEAIKNYKIDDLEVVLINRDEWHYMPPLWMDVALEGLPVEETRAPIRGLEAFGVKVIINDIVGFDLDNREVVLSDGRRVGYDYLIISLGSRNGWDSYEGLDRVGYHNYDPQSAVQLNRVIRGLTDQKIVVLVPELPFRCPIYPLEFASVLGYRIRARGYNPKITVLSPVSRKGEDLTELFGPEIKEIWDRYLTAYGVEVKTHKGLESVDVDKKIVVTKDYEEQFDILIKTPPPRLPEPLRSEAFVHPEDKRFTKVTPGTLKHPDYDDVFIVGEHALPPIGLGMAGAFVRAAAYKAATIILTQEEGVGEIYRITSIACVAHVANKGFTAICEIKFDGNKYQRTGCYSVMESSLAKMLKRAFYKGWLDRIKV